MSSYQNSSTSPRSFSSFTLRISRDNCPKCREWISPAWRNIDDLGINSMLWQRTQWFLMNPMLRKESHRKGMKRVLSVNKKRHGPNLIDPQNGLKQSLFQTWPSGCFAIQILFQFAIGANSVYVGIQTGAAITQTSWSCDFRPRCNRFQGVWVCLDPLG